MIDDRLALAVTHADGRTKRWGPDETDAQDVPAGLQFSTGLPGGFKTLTCNLLRQVDRDYHDQSLYDDVRVYGAGGQSAWEGRMAQFPRSHGDNFQVTPGAIGWSAHLLDDPSFREIYVDRDLSNWEGPQTPRRLVILNAGIGLSDPGTSIDPVGQSLVVTGITGSWAQTMDCEAWYHAGSIEIGALYYRWQRLGSAVAPTNTNWTWVANLSSDGLATVVGTGNLRAAGPGAGYLTTTQPAYHADVLLEYVVAGGADGLNYQIGWGPLAVYGRHGLTRQGSDPGGFYGSDVVADILARAAPLLNAADIQATTFVIPHLTFPDPVTGQDAVNAVNAYHQYDWGVYENRGFFFRAPNPAALAWRCRLSDGVQLSEDGAQADDVYNGVIVTYTLPDGTRRVAGPPASYWSGGVARADTTDNTLVDADPANLINQHHIPRRWGKLDISQVTTDAGAIQLGAVWLTQNRMPARRGTAIITGRVQHPTAGPMPAWRPRAGDGLIIEDDESTVRRIIETNYSHDTRQLTCTLDNSSTRLDAILERIGVVLVGVTG